MSDKIISSREQFEAGRWYRDIGEKVDYHIYIKYQNDHPTNDRFIYSNEAIVNGSHRYKHNEFWLLGGIGVRDIRNWVLVDNSEVSEFLPDGHPDKETFENQNNKTVMSKQKLTVPVTDVLRIHSVACVDWKERIAKFLSRVNADQTITFTQSEVDTMFEASTKSQLPLLEEIFGKQVKELTLKEITGNRKLFSEEPIKDGAMIEVRVHGEFKNKAFWLHQSYNWELKRDSSGLLCLIPTPKWN